MCKKMRLANWRSRLWLCWMNEFSDRQWILLKHNITYWHVDLGARKPTGRMAEERINRKLAAILAADVVGYSRLVASDEEGTLVDQI